MNGHSLLNAEEITRYSRRVCATANLASRDSIFNLTFHEKKPLPPGLLNELAEMLAPFATCVRQRHHATAGLVHSRQHIGGVLEKGLYGCTSCRRLAKTIPDMWRDVLHVIGDAFLIKMLLAAADGIEKYLSSGMIRGVGPVYAKKLVRAFGDKVFDVIEATPDRLTRTKV